MVELIVNNPLLLGLVFCVVVFQVIFLVATITKDNSLVDIFWGFNSAILAGILLFFLPTKFDSIVRFAIASAVMIWGFRLAYHIYMRNRKIKEDWRYKQWREEWGKWAIPRAWLQVFVLQAVLQWIIAIPFILALTYKAVENPQQTFFEYGASSILVVLIGLTIWLFGLTFEAVADKQLKEFLKTKKPGQIMQEGLWKYSRHPNYFGEATLWWGVWIACYGALGSALPLWTLISPITITILVRFVSGVPILEKKYKDDKNFQKYANKTNVFFPLPPRSK